MQLQFFDFKADVVFCVTHSSSESSPNNAMFNGVKKFLKIDVYLKGLKPFLDVYEAN